MSDFNTMLGAFCIGFILVLISMPKVIPYLHKMKYGQVQREEGMQTHKIKSGTPTMGGVVFLVSTILSATIVNYNNLLNSVFLLITFVLLGFGLIGFVDDILIVKYKSNKGLSALKKYLAQSIVAIVFYLLAKEFVIDFSTIITIPLTDISFDIGYFYPVLIYFMFTATSNGVNLSDGLDGLATGLVMMAIAPFVIFAIVSRQYIIASYAMALIGSLLGFMMFNYNPAKIFMGDTGSLPLGGFLAAVAILTHQEIILLIIGGVFVIETLSVIIQVYSFKTTGKRVFKMTPLHHHFELLGWSEPQVVISFWFMGFICALLGIVIGIL